MQAVLLLAAVVTSDGVILPTADRSAAASWPSPSFAAREKEAARLSPYRGPYGPPATPVSQPIGGPIPLVGPSRAHADSGPSPSYGSRPPAVQPLPPLPPQGASRDTSAGPASHAMRSGHAAYASCPPPPPRSEMSRPAGDCDACGEAGYVGPPSGSCWNDWWNPHCNMPQHHPYCPQWQGYYYFRAQHFFHLREQQAAVAAWGGDSANVCDNRFLTRIEEQYAATREPSEEEATRDGQPRPADLPRGQRDDASAAGAAFPSADPETRTPPELWTRRAAAHASPASRR